MDGCEIFHSAVTGRSKVRRVASVQGSAVKVASSVSKDALDDPRVECEICGRSIQRRSIQKHYDTHNKNRQLFPCDICGKKFTRMSTMRYHQAVHGINTKFHCPNCSRGYVRSAELRVHMSRTHGVTHPFKCLACDGAFTFIRSLKIHFRLVHGSRQPWRNNSGPAGIKEIRFPDKAVTQIDNMLHRQRGSPQVRKSSAARQGSQRNTPQDNLSDSSGEADEESDMDDELWYRSLQEENASIDAVGGKDGDCSSAEESHGENKGQASSTLGRQSLFTLLEHHLKSEDQWSVSPDINVGSSSVPPASAGSTTGSHVDNDNASADRGSMPLIKAEPAPLIEADFTPVIKTELSEGSDSESNVAECVTADTRQLDSGTDGGDGSNDCEDRPSAGGSALARKSLSLRLKKKSLSSHSEDAADQQHLPQQAMESPLSEPGIRSLSGPLSGNVLPSRKTNPEMAAMAISGTTNDALSGLRKSIWQALSSQATCS